MSTLIDAVRNAVDADRLWKHVEWSSRVRRDTGGPGEERMVDYIVDELTRAGVPVRVHSFDAYLSYPRHATLEVRPEGGEPFQVPCLTHSFTRSTGPHGLVGRLKYLPDRDMNLAAGRIAVLDGVATPIDVLGANRAGAQAVIFCNPGPYIHNMIETTIWGGAPTPSQVDRLPTIPVVSVASQNGAAIKELLHKGPVDVKIVTHVETGWYPVKLPEVIIPGDRSTEEFILVGGHYCSWEVGTTDNSTGVSVLLEMARVLWEHRDQLKRSIRIAWWPGHSHGRYAGSTWYADTFFEDLRKHCVVYHNIDSPGVRGATEYILRHTSAEMETFAREVVQRYIGQEDPAVHRPSRAADQSFLDMGVPSCSLYSFLPDDHPDKRPWTGGCAGAWWWHTEHDTLDKASREVLHKDCQLSTTFVSLLATADVLPIDLTVLVDEIHTALKRLDEEIGQHVDLKLLVAKSERLVAAVAELNNKPVDGDPAAVQARNRILMGISRALNPVVYGLEGPYGHDVAERVPRMTAHRGAKMYGLSRGVELNALEGTTEYGFLKVDIQRQVNRAAEALDAALELIGAGR
ncbi:MAG: M28 family peptidase [Firmicutes bacterium]|nr:M28 family peptidase [Bacillota bacterium]